MVSFQSMTTSVFLGVCVILAHLPPLLINFILGHLIVFTLVLHRTIRIISVLILSHNMSSYPDMLSLMKITFHIVIFTQPLPILTTTSSLLIMMTHLPLFCPRFILLPSQWPLRHTFLLLLLSIHPLLLIIPLVSL